MERLLDKAVIAVGCLAVLVALSADVPSVAALLFAVAGVLALRTAMLASERRQYRVLRDSVREGTVRNHISSILQKTGLRNRTQLAIAYLEGADKQRRIPGRTARQT